jgi:uncharacterized DUF497 family protein
MKCTWHEEKRLRNLKKHCLDLNLACKVFSGLIFDFKDTRFDYGEQGFISIGLLENVVLIVHTEINKEIRIISMRGAIKNEQKFYYKNLYG